MKNCIALAVVVATFAATQHVQAQQGFASQTRSAQMRAAAAARKPQGGGLTQAPFGSSKYGHRSINGHVPYSPVGSMYKVPTGHAAVFNNLSSYYGASSGIGLYYPAAGQAQRRR